MTLMINHKNRGGIDIGIKFCSFLSFNESQKLWHSLKNIHQG